MKKIVLSGLLCVSFGHHAFAEDYNFVHEDPSYIHIWGESPRVPDEFELADHYFTCYDTEFGVICPPQRWTAFRVEPDAEVTHLRVSNAGETVVLPYFPGIGTEMIELNLLGQATGAVKLLEGDNEVFVEAFQAERPLASVRLSYPVYAVRVLPNPQ